MNQQSNEQCFHLTASLVSKSFYFKLSITSLHRRLHPKELASCLHAHSILWIVMCLLQIWKLDLGYSTATFFNTASVCVLSIRKLFFVPNAFKPTNYLFFFQICQSLVTPSIISAHPTTVQATMTQSWASTNIMEWRQRHVKARWHEEIWRRVTIKCRRLVIKSSRIKVNSRYNDDLLLVWK